MDAHDTETMPRREFGTSAHPGSINWMDWLPCGTWLRMMSCPSVTSRDMNLAFSVLTKAGTMVAAVRMIAAKVLVCGAIAARVLVCGVEAVNTTAGTPRASAIGLPVVPAMVTVALARPTLLPVDPSVQTSTVALSFRA